ncbi:MAG TPA: peptidylprolyl isomerase [Bryobacteraceae bacterium]
MTKLTLSLGSLLFGAAIASAQVSPDTVVLTVGNEKITQKQFELIVATLPEQAQAQASSPEGRRAIADRLAELKTLAQEGRSRKLDQKPEIAAQLSLEADQVLAGAVYQSLGSADEAAMHAYYDAHKADMEQVHARHILIRFQGSQVPIRTGQKDLSDAEALQKTKDLRAKLVAGAKFEELAKAESDDVGSGSNGGDLDTFGHGAMVKPFEDAAFSIKVGEVSQPVKSDFGYHLILVESRTSKTFEQAKAEIEKAVGPDAAQKGLDELKKKTTVVYNDAFFGK